MLEEMAREPKDMGLSEQELCPNPLVPWWIPAATIFFIGDPGERFRRAFSPSIMGDISASIPMRDKSKDGMEMGALQKYGGVFGPVAGLIGTQMPGG